jgi:hypothetical protein
MGTFPEFVPPEFKIILGKEIEDPKGISPMARVSPSQQQTSYQEKSYGVRPAFGIFVVLCLLFAIWLLYSNRFWILGWIFFLFHIPLTPATYHWVYYSHPAPFPVAVGVLLLMVSPFMAGDITATLLGVPYVARPPVSYMGDCC